MWAHPGKKLLFQGCEFAQEQEWQYDQSLDWHLLEDPGHRGVQSLIRDLNRVYARQPALWERDFDARGVLVARAQRRRQQRLRVRAHRLRRRREGIVVCVMNLAPGARARATASACRAAGAGSRRSTPTPRRYGGPNVGNLGGVETEAVPWHNQPQSAELTLPPLGVLYLVPEG